MKSAVFEALYFFPLDKLLKAAKKFGIARGRSKEEVIENIITSKNFDIIAYLAGARK